MDTTKLQDNDCAPKKKIRINLCKKDSCVILSEFGIAYFLEICEDKIELRTEKGTITLSEVDPLDKRNLIKKEKIRCPLDQRKIFELLNKELKFHLFHF